MTEHTYRKMEFRDLKRQYQRLKPQIDRSLSEVISSTHFIAGEKVQELEKLLAAYVGVKHCITCANGTDAISIALLAYGIGEGDAVFVPDFTFFSSGECPASIGAVPVFVDVCENTYNLNPAALEDAINTVADEGRLRPKAVIAVDLFGRPFDYETIQTICNKYHLILLEDAAQGFGGYYTTAIGEKRMACSLGDIATTSFFPAKPLGCYGDGGAIFTDDDHIASLCRSIAVHGKDMENANNPYAKYNNIRIGMNSRLDTIQAAVLLAKFSVFCDEELTTVNRVATFYSDNLMDVPNLTVPIIEENRYSSWAQYTVILPFDCDRGKIQKSLSEYGIPTNIYYVKPLHRQRAFIGSRSEYAECKITEMLCKRVLCLPMHPYLSDGEMEFVVTMLKKALGREMFV